MSLNVGEAMMMRNGEISCPIYKWNFFFGLIQKKKESEEIQSGFIKWNRPNKKKTQSKKKQKKNKLHKLDEIGIISVNACKDINDNVINVTDMSDHEIWFLLLFFNPQTM